MEHLTPIQIKILKVIFANPKATILFIADHIDESDVDTATNTVTLRTYQLLRQKTNSDGVSTFTVTTYGQEWMLKNLKLDALEKLTLNIMCNAHNAEA